MSPKRLERAFFNRPTLLVAREMLGKYIVTVRGGRERAGMICETEAYKGPQDAASHARGGRRTPRVEPLYGDGGTVYVYLCYGIHWMLNFATVGEGKPEGILIRGVFAGEGARGGLVRGPGLVTRELRVDRSLNGADAAYSPDIRVEDRGVRVVPGLILKGPRVGVEPAGQYWASRPWRFRIDPARLGREGAQ
jgi:DNA-3-methyladenine glycosylase